MSTLGMWSLLKPITRAGGRGGGEGGALASTDKRPQTQSGLTANGLSA